MPDQETAATCDHPRFIPLTGECSLCGAPVEFDPEDVDDASPTHA